MSGYLKLYRKVADSEVFSDEGVAFTWMMLLIQCQWKRTKSDGITLEPGQILFTWRKLPERLQGAMLSPVAVNTLRARMDKLESCGAITVKSFGRYSIATINNWSKYQGEAGAKADTITVSKSDTTKPTVSKTDTIVDTVTDTIIDTVVDTIDSVHPVKKQAENASKKEKKVKKEKKEIPPKSPKGDRGGFDPLKVEMPSQLDSPEFQAAWEEWCQHSAERKSKPTQTATCRQLTELAKLGKDRAIAAIHHSVANGWQGIFEPTKSATKLPSKPHTAPRLMNEEEMALFRAGKITAEELEARA